MRWLIHSNAPRFYVFIKVFSPEASPKPQVAISLIADKEICERVIIILVF